MDRPSALKLPHFNYLSSSLRKIKSRLEAWIKKIRSVLEDKIGTDSTGEAKMAVTPLMWKSLDNYSKIWSHLWRTPLDWDAKEGKLVHNGISRKLIPWAVSLYFVTTPWLLVSFLFCIEPLTGSNPLPFQNYMKNLGLFSIGSLIVMGETSNLLFAKDCVHGFNCFLHFQKSLQKSKA